MEVHLLKYSKHISTYSNNVPIIYIDKYNNINGAIFQYFDLWYFSYILPLIRLCFCNGVFLQRGIVTFTQYFFFHSIKVTPAVEEIASL